MAESWARCGPSRVGFFLEGRHQRREQGDQRVGWRPRLHRRAPTPLASPSSSDFGAQFGQEGSKALGLLSSGDALEQSAHRRIIRRQPDGQTTELRERRAPRHEDPRALRHLVAIHDFENTGCSPWMAATNACSVRSGTLALAQLAARNVASSEPAPVAGIPPTLAR